METTLGKKMIKHSIDILSETGYHCFNFRNLAKDMQSTEASVYRYFENKHMLLVYLCSWYWDYLNYLIEIDTRNVTDPELRLRNAIKTIVNGPSAPNPSDFIDQSKLHAIIVEHFFKAMFNKTTTVEEKENLFANYRNLNANLTAIVKECNPEFKYPCAMASTIIKMSIDHSYYADQICSLTEITNCINTKKDQIEEMINYFVQKLLS
jgi:AcrR family transcriptional regulator